MTNRISKPDTVADVDLRKCLDAKTSFVMIAGAGSGKTTSLVKALDYLGRTYSSSLRARGQKIACITYTEVATDQIFGDVGNDPLFHVSTIHSFLWSLIRPFPIDIQAWVSQRVGEKLAELELERQKFGPRTKQNTRDKNGRRTQKYQDLRATVAGVRRFTYGTGSDYANGILGHDDIIKMVPALMQSRPLLRKIVARKYPFFFVDESQDTLPVVVEVLKAVKRDMEEKFCLGFFGDPMQKIYSTGVGRIEKESGWAEIKKPENFRCPAKVLELINKIRQPVGDLTQTLGLKSLPHAISGSAMMFVLPANSGRDAGLAGVREFMAREGNDPLWTDGRPDKGAKTLVLVHRAAATRLGFGGIYAALNDGTSDAFKVGLAEGTLWAVRPFLDFALPLVEAAKHDKFQVISMLRKHSPRLHPLELTLNSSSGKKASDVLLSLREDTSRLAHLLEEGSAATVLEILQFIKDSRLLDIDPRFSPYLSSAGSGKEEVTDEAPRDDEDSEWISAALKGFLGCRAVELWGYRKYINDETVYSTQHGTKGDEFERVLLVLDDEESDYNLYSYEKLFGITPLSEIDERNSAGGRETVIDRTRRLFYVCCSRSYKDLAVVLFTKDVEKAVLALKSLGMFAAENIFTADILIRN